MAYQAFIDDPATIEAAEGQRYVVLRPGGAVAEEFARVRELLRVRLAKAGVAFPARAHATLAGFAAGTSLGDVQDVVADWAETVQPLPIEIDRVGFFATPSQIVVVRLRKTPALFDALAGLRRRAADRGLAIDTSVHEHEWIFHMSLAYCAEMSHADWRELTAYLQTMAIPAARYEATEAEVVAFDRGLEYSGGVYALGVGSIG